MTVDWSSYVVPGVYVQEQTTPLVPLLGVAPAVVGLVGPSVGYRTATETVTLTGTNAVQLTHLGIDTDSVVVTANDGTLYADTTDYALTVAGGADEDTQTTTDNTTSIARPASGSTITSGASVVVSYHYTDADYAAVHRVEDFDDVKELFGEPLSLTANTITSPLSLAAQIAFANGATELVLATTSGTASTTTQNELATALEALETVEDIGLVVPLPVGVENASVTAVANDLRAHCVTMSGQGLYRVGLIGFDTVVTTAPNTIAAGIGSERVVLAWPTKLSYYNGFTGTTLTVGGQYLAAAYAGILAAGRVQDPLTRKRVRGFAGIDPSVSATKATRNTYSDNGVAVAETDRQGRLVVRHGVTTLRTSISTRELSLVRAKDQLIRMLADGIEDSEMIGVPITADTPLEVKGVAAGLLESAKAAGVIVDYADLKARQRSLDPTIIEIRFSYKPAFPLNYVVVVFSINVSTGEVEEATAA